MFLNQTLYNLKKLFSDSVYTGLSHLTFSISQIILQVFIVRWTSQQEFGEFVVANAIENLIELVFTVRSGEIALQYIGKYWVSGDHIAARLCANRIIKLDLMIYFIVYGLTVIFSILISYFIKFNYLYLIGLALQIPAQIGFGAYKSIFISANKIKEQAIFEIKYSLIYFLLSMIGVYFLGIPGLITASAVSALLKNIFARSITYRWWLPIDPAYSRERLFEKQEMISTESWWKFSMSSMLRNLFTSSANQVDVLMISAFQGAESTAIYKVARSLSSLPVRIIAPVWSALRPRMMYAINARNKKQLLKLITVPAALMLGLFVISIIPICFFAGDIIVKIYGTNYMSSALPFIILLIGGWLYTGVTAWFNFWIVISNKMRSGIYVSGFLLISTLILGISIGSGSPVHMAIAVASAMIMTSAICWFYFVSTLNKDVL